MTDYYTSLYELRPREVKPQISINSYGLLTSAHRCCDWLHVFHKLVMTKKPFGSWGEKECKNIKRGHSLSHVQLHSN